MSCAAYVSTPIIRCGLWILCPGPHTRDRMMTECHIPDFSAEYRQKVYMFALSAATVCHGPGPAGTPAPVADWAGHSSPRPEEVTP